MNYHKLFSRFYNAGEQQNSAELQRCDNFSSGLPPDESKAPEAGDDIHVDFEYEQRHEDETLVCEIDNSTMSWDTSTRDQVPVTIEPISSEQVRWFYKAVDDKVWCEFNGYDSLLIENKYRDLKTKIDDSADANCGDYVEIDKIVPNEKSSFKHLQIKLDVKNGAGEHTNKSPNKKSKYECDIDRSKLAHKDCDINSVSENELENCDINDQPIDNINTIIVRGGMYEVNLITMTCVSIYWPGEQCSITRGLYFYDGSWQPLEGCYGEVIEEQHLRLFGSGSKNVFEQSTPQPGIAVHSHHFPDFHVEWLSACELYLYWGGAPRQLVRSVTQKLGFYQSTGYRLKRGYKNKASALERPPDITHVVFVIHGIGQKMDSGRIIRNTNALRTNCDWLTAQYSNCGGKDGKGRAELFPARWRAGERGSAAALLEAAAPIGAPALRRAINDAAMDVMYYTSPVYGKQVQDDLTQELNRLYTMFMARNPNYKGQFSAVAHSLGCVILYDIVTGHKIGCERCISRDAETSSNKGSGLLFQLQQVFCLGSPLGVFLSLRQANSSSAQILPTGFKTRLYNIFYISDPVAYRLEPLVARWLSEHPPLVIPPHYAAPLTSPSSQNSPAKGPWKIWSYVKHPWQRSETGSPLPNTNPQNISDINDNSASKLKYYENSPKKNLQPNMSEAVCENFIDSKTDNIVNCDIDDDINLQDPRIMMAAEERKNSNSNINDSAQMLDSEVRDDLKNEVTGEYVDATRNPEEVLPYRIDYTLKDSGIANNYIWAITSHTSYWNNYDVAYFVLSHLFSDDGGNEESQLVNDNISS